MFARIVRCRTRFFSSAVVSTNLVKELRQLTGAPILDCKNALKDEETQGDINLAVEWLRKKGVSVAAKKQNRTADEGMIGLLQTSSSVTMVEVRSETDFVARNDNFLEFMKDTLDAISISRTTNIESLLTTSIGIKTLNDSLMDLVSKMSEKIEIKSAFHVDTNSTDEITYSYLHAPFSKFCGTRASFITLSVPSVAELSVENRQEVDTLGSDIALQVVGGSCLFLNNLSEEFKQNEYEIEKEALLQSIGETEVTEKLTKKLDKKVEKKMKQLENDVILMNQKLITGSGTVKQALQSISTNTKRKIQIKQAVRFEINGDNKEIL